MLGGAVAGNAGSFETEIKDLVTEIRLAGYDGEIKTMNPMEAGFSYRGSNLLDAGIITGVTLSLKKSTPEEVASKLDEFLKRKMDAQPIGQRSAGCVFKNPEGNFAGRLIDTAGCKGLKQNDIEVSKQHANFFINTGKGNSADFLSLMEKVSEKVYEVHGIRLEAEIKVPKIEPESDAQKVKDR
jgi:UDP-N-acetylmuramate dehydrogenase